MVINILTEAKSGTRLWFAEKGKELRDKIVNRLTKANEQNIVILDFDRIEVTDTSYAREGFIKLVSEISLNSVHPQIIFKNVEEYVKQNLHLSFSHHKLFTLVVNSRGKWDLIGKFSEQNVQTVNALIKRKEASAKQIAKDLGELGMSTSMNRLTQLYNSCVCSRKELVQPTGGKEYLFKIEI